jgi:hypothetical protein
MPEASINENGKPLFWKIAAPPKGFAFPSPRYERGMNLGDSAGNRSNMISKRALRVYKTLP